MEQVRERCREAGWLPHLLDVGQGPAGGRLRQRGRPHEEADRVVTPGAAHHQEAHLHGQEQDAAAGSDHVTGVEGRR